MYVVLIGVENQSNIHYAMPVKNMIYDALSYGKQVNKTKIFHSKRKDYKSEDEFLSGFTKNDKIIPVITITLYLGLKPWDGPRKLTDMMANLDERLLQFVSDYNINLVDPAEISDFDKFRTELKQLLEVLHNSYDREKLQDIIQKDERFKSLNRETVDAINTFAGTNIEVNEDEEVIDMCKAWEDQKEAGIQEGRKVGIKEGRKAGIQEGKFNVLLSLVQDGTLEINIAANKMNMTVDEFKNYMKTIKV